MTVAVKSFPSSHCAPLDGEQGLVAHLIQAATEAGVRASPAAIVNLYVALKSKPLAILAGPAHSGKIALVNSLAQALTGGDSFQYQAMTGHAWWAERSGNLSLFTDGQMRLNTCKILDMIEEALRPENADQVFMACLTRICPAEVVGFFSEVAFQLWHGQIMRLPAAHLTEPIPWPPNMFLIGTMDAARFDWRDNDLLSRTTIVPWSGAQAAPVSAYLQIMSLPLDSASQFLRSTVRSARAACLKLCAILGKQLPSICPLFLVENLLRAQAVPLPQSAISEAIVYLANAWSDEGVGLFDSATPRNLAIALDLTIAQVILPRVEETVRESDMLRGELAGVLTGRFPQSTMLLEHYLEGR